MGNSIIRRFLGALVLLAAVLVPQFEPTQSQAAPKGVSGSFEMYYARNPAGSSEPSFTITVPGTFAAAGDDFLAEANYPLPGGGNEKVRLLLLDKAQKILLLYPETLNFRRVKLEVKLKELMASIPEMVGTYFEATPESLQKQGMKLISQGRAVVNGEKLLAYTLQLPTGAEPSVKDKTGAEWKAKLFFTPSSKRLRLLQVTARDSLLRLKLLDVKKADIKPDRFKVPNGYYETEPLNITSGDHG